MAQATAQEINYVKIAVRQGIKISTIAKNIDRTIPATRKIIDRHCPQAGSIRWSEIEDKRILLYYPSMSWDELQNRLRGRTRAAISGRAAFLGIRRILEDRPKTKIEGVTFTEPVDRNCLKCGVAFVAEGRFLRLCPVHRRSSTLADHSVAI